MKALQNVSRTLRTAALPAVLIVAAAGAAALGTGRSFLTLDSGFQQELWATVQLDADEDGFAKILGGVAFAPDGDVWSAECLFSGTTLHRFDAQSFRPTTHATSTLHQQIATVPSAGGCGLTNHPDGFIYSNSEFGLVKIDAATGATVAGPMGLPGNSLGVAVDPTNNHLVYVGADCHPQAPAGTTNCTIYDLDPAAPAPTATIFAQLDKAATHVAFVDGVYFDPTGQYLFMASRPSGPGSDALAIVSRPTGLPYPDATQLVNYVPMVGREPDGVAFFNGTPKFVVTLDEEGDTMTRFDFPLNPSTGQPDYRASAGAVTQSDFATAGFRGDLLQVGADGCIYATQGRHVLPTDHGSRYDGNSDPSDPAPYKETTEDSIVRICVAPGNTGGFAPPPGVNSAPAPTGRIGDFVWDDLDRDGMQDGGEPGLVTTVTLKTSDGATVIATTTSTSAGFYEFTNLPLGSYKVVAATPVGYAPTTPFVGGPGVDSNGSPADVTLAAGHLDDSTIDFGFVSLRGSIGDFVWNDVNTNGVQDAGEPGMVTSLTLKSGSTVVATTTSSSSGFYQFTNVPLGTYTVEASTPSGFSPTGSMLGGNPAKDSNGSPATVTLSPSNLNDATIDFGFKALRGSIAGVTFKDYNRNGVRDAGEPIFANVSPITLSGTASASTSSNGSGAYSFSNLLAGNYQVTAPGTIAGGWVLSTPAAYPNPRSVALGPGQNVTGVDFGYYNQNPPVCTVQTFPNENPFRGVMTYTAPNGLKTLVITKNLNNNFAITWSPSQNFTVGTTSPVSITGRLINSNVAAQLIAVATDMYGNQVTCDPLVTTVVRDRGREEPETYTDLPYEESLVTIENNDPGLRGLDVIVNGELFRVRALRDGETDTLNIRSAMRPGNNNTVTLIARGRPGGSAVVTIAEPSRRVRRR